MEFECSVFRILGNNRGIMKRLGFIDILKRVMTGDFSTSQGCERLSVGMDDQGRTKGLTITHSSQDAVALVWDSINDGDGSGLDADLIRGQTPDNYIAAYLAANPPASAYPSGAGFQANQSLNLNFASNVFFQAYSPYYAGTYTWTFINPVLGKTLYILMSTKPTTFNLNLGPNVTVIGTYSSQSGKSNLIRVTCIDANYPKYIAEILVH